MAAAPSAVPRVYHLFSESESVKRFFSRMNEVKVLKEGYALSTDAGIILSQINPRRFTVNVSEFQFPYQLLFCIRHIAPIPR